MSLSELMVDLWPDEKIALACRVLGKNVEDYAHLDSGRKSMTGGNLLRNALKKDESLLAHIAEEASSIRGTRDPLTQFAPKKESSGKRAAPSSPSDHTRSQEKNFGKREQPEWVFDEKELQRLETAHMRDEILRKQGALPPRILLYVSTPEVFMDFRGEAIPKYHSVKRQSKGKLTFR